MYKKFSIVFLAVLLSGCWVEDVEYAAVIPFDGKIIASVEGGKELSDVAKVVLNTLNNINIYNIDREVWDQHVFASADFVNGGFTMHLPAIVNEKFLSKAEEVYSFLYYDGKAKAGYENAKMVKFYAFRYTFFAFNAEGDWVGYFSYENIDYSYCCGSFPTATAWGNLSFIYVDKDYIYDIINGNRGPGYVSMNKGWNIVIDNYNGFSKDRGKISDYVWRFYRNEW